MNLNFSNRPVRTRMPGGVGGVGQRSDCPYPDSLPREAIQSEETLLSQ